MKKQKIDKINQAKLQLQLVPQAMFFAQAIIETPWNENKGIDTACTDGKGIDFNPEFIKDLNIENVKWLVLHEIMHIQLSHPERKALVPGLDQMKCNIAMDYEINSILETIPGIKRIDGCLFDKQFDGLSWEKIYKLLPDNNQNQQNQGKGSSNGTPQSQSNQNGMSNDVKPATGTKEEIEKKISDNAGKNQLAKMVAEKFGSMPGNIEASIKAVVPKLQWSEILQKMIVDKTFSDYNYRKFNRRYEDFYPSLEGEKINLVIGFDVSGSMYNHINTVVSDIENLCFQLVGDYKIRIIQFDTDIIKDEIFENEFPEIKVTGLGGTDFRVFFKHIDNQEIDNALVVVLTDLDGPYPNDPGYPVIFVDYGGYRKRVPFGELITID